MNKIILSLSTLLALIISASAQNTVCFDNQSGEPAFVKLIGATSSEIEVPDGTKQAVQASAGKYVIKVRYGVPGKYHYTKGEEFDVKETATTTSKITITLHKVVNGNYDSRPINEEEFGVSAPNASGKARVSESSLVGLVQPPESLSIPEVFLGKWAELEWFDEKFGKQTGINSEFIIKADSITWNRKEEGKEVYAIQNCKVKRGEEMIVFVATRILGSNSATGEKIRSNIEVGVTIKQGQLIATIGSSQTLYPGTGLLLRSFSCKVVYDRR